MNTDTHDTLHDDTPDLGDSLRWQLRALRRDEAPGRDLWPGIVAALKARPSASRRPSWLAPAAMAAGLLLVVGAVGSQATLAPDATPPPPTLVQREADDLTRHYQAALQELAVSPGGSLQRDFAILDRDTALIRAALDLAPNSRLLLEQLRRTYAHRLALAQRVAYS